jgi:adenylate cyclase class IV
MPQVRPTRTHDEIEIKLALPSPDSLHALKSRLKQLRASARPRVFERNTLFDRAAELRAAGRLLRIRIEHPAPVPRGASAENLHQTARRAQRSRIGRAILTYKAPPETDESDAAPTSTSLESNSGLGSYKRRQEIEVEVKINSHPAENLESILHALGFTAGFIYEKFRTTYTLRKLPGLKIELDETPLGNFLELEGPPKSIDRAASLLGFRTSNYLTATYWDLHVADCRGRNLTPGHLLFAAK